MSALTITRRHARRLLLAHQGLWPPRKGTDKSAILRFIRTVGCIQYDPLDIAGRNPDLVLQSRISDYRRSMLDELLYRDRLLLDGWDKMMAIFPLEDWPNFRRRREASKEHSGRSREEVNEVLPLIRQELTQCGPLSSIDIHIDRKVDWSWAPTRLAKAALESLYHWGELVVHHRVNTRRYYDFSHNHIPANLLNAPDPHQTEERYADWYVKRRLGGIGLQWKQAGDGWLGVPFKSPARVAALSRLLARGEVLELQVKGLTKPLYMCAEQLLLLKETREAGRRLRASFIAPLDNLIWDRKLIDALFDFHYRWEVYKPAALREYGYYVLPVLYGDRFIGRFEPVRDKKNGRLLIRNWWWESGIKPTIRMKTELRLTLLHFLRFLECDRIILDKQLLDRPDLDWLFELHGELS